MKEEVPEPKERHAHSHIEGYTHEHLYDVPHEYHGTMPGKAVLNVAGVDFKCRSDPVLQGIMVGVTRGEILAILGLNGVEFLISFVRIEYCAVVNDFAG